MGFLEEAKLELGPKGWRGLGETKRMQCSAGGENSEGRSFVDRSGKWILTYSQGRCQRTWNPRMESLNLHGKFSSVGLSTSGGNPQQVGLPV